MIRIAAVCLLNNYFLLFFNKKWLKIFYSSSFAFFTLGFKTGKMADKQAFLQSVSTGYSFTAEHVKIGMGMLDGELVDGAYVSLPLKTMNRHGLIAGATGTGKTKTLQLISEFLSDHSVPVLLMDIKGDLSGIAAAGSASEKLIERSEKIGINFSPSAFPVELLTLSNEKGYVYAPL